MRVVIIFALFTYAFAAGGWRNVPVDDEEIQKAVRYASEALSRSMNSLYHQKVVHVHNALQQVVAGMNYKLTVTIGSTTCKKREIDYSEVDTCEVRMDNPAYSKCVVKVFRSLDGEYHTKQFSCEDSSATGGRKTRGELNERAMFENFMAKHKKQYKDEIEKEGRFKIFKRNLQKITLLNDHEQGTAKYGVTQFSDLSSREFKKFALGFRTDLLGDDEMVKAKIPSDPLPESFDWRQKNVVTEVKNQGQCGSCWAFSTTGNIEGQWAIKKKSLVSLSEQELVDCDKVDEGCNGGLPSNAYKEIERLGGLEGEKDYPYEGADEKCELDKREIRVFINSSVAISQNETEMAAWLVKNGPISIGINANAMQFYFGGISHPWKFLCNPSNLDHGVLIVGYGVHTYPLFKKTLPFWIVKNSWGASWGEQGYYRVYRGDGTCGVNMMATSAVID